LENINEPQKMTRPKRRCEAKSRENVSEADFVSRNSTPNHTVRNSRWSNLSVSGEFSVPVVFNLF
jgi:hypothetical protein